MSITQPTLLTHYLNILNGTTPHSAKAAFYTSLDHMNAYSPSVGAAIFQDLHDQCSIVL